MSDERFAALDRDPRFRIPRKKAIRDKVDPRFKSALKEDKQFRSAAPIDRYGRKIKDSDVADDLGHLYNLEDSDSAAESSENGENEPISRARALMRGEVGSDSASSSESDSESDAEDDIEAALAHQIDEYERVRVSGTVIPQGEATRRFAVVNMDWDNLTATDLMAAFSSFAPPTKRIVAVRIYPSEYGKKRMQEEEMTGPPEDLFDANEPQPKGGDSDGEDFSSSRLRRYQLQRLQYYYAIVECEDIETAAAIYTSCDGREFESTANFFDLRFVPDEVDFGTDKPYDECDGLPVGYQPTAFVTDALQHTKVRLTWDETPKERLKIAQKAFNAKELEDQDLRAYLASDSDSDDAATTELGDDNSSRADKLRAMLGLDAKKRAGQAIENSDDSDVQMEITFKPVLEGQNAKLEIIPDTKDEGEGGALTTIEQYRLKEKQRRLKRKEAMRARREAGDQSQTKSGADAELELLAMDDDLLKKASDASPGPTQQKHHKLTKRASKRKAQADAEQDFNTADPRFQALFEEPDFAIDATAPQFKRTTAMNRVIAERRQRLASRQQSDTTAKPRTTLTGPRSDNWRELASRIRNKADGAAD